MKTIHRRLIYAKRHSLFQFVNKHQLIAPQIEPIVMGVAKRELRCHSKSFANARTTGRKKNPQQDADTKFAPNVVTSKIGDTPVVLTYDASFSTLLDVSFSQSGSSTGNLSGNVLEEYKKILASEQKITPKFTSQHDMLLWVQGQRDVGLYVECDNCNKIRFLADVRDPLDMPEFWYCHMNPDPMYNSCNLPEQYIDSYELAEMIDNKYNAGSVIWAKVTGHPWATAIVDDDPDLAMYYWMDDEYSDVPTSYHVTFLGNPVSRAWCTLKNIKPFVDNPERKVEYRAAEVEYWREIAKQALDMPLSERLQKYSFLTRYTGRIYDTDKFWVSET